MSCCSRIRGEAAPTQPTSSCLRTYGVRSVCVLTGATFGALTSGKETFLHIRHLIETEHFIGRPFIGITVPLLAIATPFAMVGSSLMGALPGAMAGYCVANQILAKKKETRM